MGFDYVQAARDFAKRNAVQAPPAPLQPASDADELVSRAVSAANKVYEPGAIAWAAEFRPDLLEAVAEVEAAVGGADRWRDWTPARMQGLRALLLRWYEAQERVSEGYRAWRAEGAGRTA